MTQSGDLIRANELVLLLLGRDQPGQRVVAVTKVCSFSVSVDEEIAAGKEDCRRFLMVLREDSERPKQELRLLIHYRMPNLVVTRLVKGWGPDTAGRAPSSLQPALSSFPLVAAKDIEEPTEKTRALGSCTAPHLRRVEIRDRQHQNCDTREGGND